MQTHDTAPLLEKLTRALGTKAEQLKPEDLEDELRTYLDYGVPPDQAIRTILRHHGVESAPASGGAPSGPSPDGPVKLNDLPPNAPAVDILARVIAMNTRKVMARGEEKEIVSGLLGDETATVPFTSWRPLEGLEKGDVIEIQGAYTKVFRDETQINFGDRARINKKEADAIPDKPAEYQALTIDALRPGLRAFQVTGRILTVDARQVNVQGNPKTLYGGRLADETGVIEYTCWDDIGLQADTVVTIQGASIRAFRGVAQLNFDAQATITPFTEEFATADEIDVINTMTIGEIIAKGDVGDLATRATLLEVRPGSGLVWRDPETNRVVPTGQTPGAKPDLRIKMILDDGTGAVSAVVGRAATEGFLGKDVDACMAEAKEAMRTEIIQEQLAEKLEGRVFLAEGFARTDDYGTMVICRSLKEDHEDVEKAAEEILAKIKGGA